MRRSTPGVIQPNGPCWRGLARSLERYVESFKQALNEAVRVGLAKLEERADAAPEASRTRPLPLGRRLAGGIDNVAEVLAIAEGEDYR